MKLIKIGIFTINPDAIDFIQGEREDYCEIVFRSSQKLPIYMSQDAVTRSIISQMYEQV